MRQNWLKRIYMYEAFILVLASSLLGIIIGTPIVDVVCVVWVCLRKFFVDVQEVLWGTRCCCKGFCSRSCRCRSASRGRS